MVCLQFLDSQVIPSTLLPLVENAFQDVLWWFVTGDHKAGPDFRIGPILLWEVVVFPLGSPFLEDSLCVHVHIGAQVYLIEWDIVWSSDHW